MTHLLSLWGDAGATTSWLDTAACDVATPCAVANATTCLSAISLSRL
jgi:glutamate dehydrogenase/leucine dehydrogenase